MDTGIQELMVIIERLSDDVHDLKHRCRRIEHDVTGLENYIYGAEDDEDDSLNPEEDFGDELDFISENETDELQEELGDETR
jgi:hypothetical protein